MTIGAAIVLCFFVGAGFALIAWLAYLEYKYEREERDHEQVRQKEFAERLRRMTERRP